MCSRVLLLAAAFSCALTCVARGGEAVYDVRDHGAKPDGQTLCTAAIQKSIDLCAQAGGGTVLVPPGRFLAGTVRLRSHVTLKLDAGAVLLGSTDIKDYPSHTPGIRSYTDNYVKHSLILAEDVDDVAIVGQGTIDGQGAALKVRKDRPYENRPYAIRMINCRDVRVEGITLRNSAMWMQHYLACDRVLIRGIRVNNHVNANNDGLDIDGCRDVIVTQCTIDSDDDAICLKSTLDRPCENVSISDCLASSHCNAIKMGTESNGGFVNVTISNCVVSSPHGSKEVYGARRGLAGVALEVVDGGRMENVTVSNIAIRGVSVPLFVRLGNRARPFTTDGAVPGVGSVRNVNINNIVATNVSPIGCSITGLPDHPIERLSLSNLRFEFEGGGSKGLADKTPAENAAKYPECTMFGDLPAYGLYLRHVRGVSVNNVSVAAAKPDFRHALVGDDVEEASIDSFNATFSAGGAAVLHLINTRRLTVRDCQPEAPGGTFLKYSGRSSRKLNLMCNDLSEVGSIAEAADGANPETLAQTANRR